MAKFVPIQQQGARAGAERGPRFVPIQPAAPTPQQAGGRSAAARPGAQAAHAEGRVQEMSPRLRLEQAGVSLQEAPSGAQFEFGLGAGAAGTPQAREELARRALGEGTEVRTDPDTGRVLFRPSGEQQFRVFNAPGPSLGDVTRFAPEAGVLGAGIGGGVGLGVAGAAAGGPFLGGTGVVAGEGLGEGVGEFVRLMEAAERGLIDLSYDEIVDRAQRRGAIAGGSALAGGALLSVARRLLARNWGVDAAVVEAMGDRPVREALDEARRVRQDAQRVTGESLPLTLGQQTGTPEILRAEQAARQTRGGARALRPVEEGQQAVVEGLQEQAFGQAVTQPERRELGGAILEQTNQRAQRSQEALSAAEQGAFGTARPPESAIAGVRRLAEEGREQVFAPLRQQFDRLQQEKGIQIDLAPLREGARVTRTQREQGIFPSVGAVRKAWRLLKEAEGAGRRTDGGLGPLTMTEEGMPDWVRWLNGDDAFEPRSLGEVQRALRDIRRELRRPGILDEPQQASVLGDLERSLKQARNESLDDESLARVMQLERQYAEASHNLDRGVVNEFMSVDPNTGRARLTGQQAIDTLLRSPEDASEFVRALGTLPNKQQAMFEAQNGVMGLLRERFQDETTGMISPQKLKSFLNNRSNERAMRALFSDRPDVLKSLRNAESAARELNDINRAMQRVRTRTEKLLGVETADPTLIANQVLRDASPAAAKRIQNVLPTQMRDVYKRSLAQEIRDTRLLNSQGAPDASKIDAFLRSDRSQVARAVLGKGFVDDLGVLRDTIRLVGQEAGRDAPADLAQAFTRDAPALKGLMRLARVPLGVMTVRARGAVALMGIAGDETRQRLAEVMADPSKLRKLSSLANLPVGSRRAEIILGRLGFGAFLEMSDRFSETETRRGATQELANPPQEEPSRAGSFQTPLSAP